MTTRTALVDYADSLSESFGYKVGYRDALSIAAEYGRTIGMYASPVEPAREGLTVREAAYVAAEDPSLVWVA